MILQFIIPGVPQSGNHAKSANGFRRPESREYDRRIVSIAKAAVVIARWTMPDYVKLDLFAYNARADGDNIRKEVCDPLEGIVFAHDSRILDGRTVRCKDDDLPRVVVQVQAVDGADYGFAKPRTTATPTAVTRANAILRDIARMRR